MFIYVYMYVCTYILYILFYYINYNLSFIGILQLRNGRWICPNSYCGRTYKKKFSLYRHCRQECGVEPQYRCLCCMKTFKRKESLKSHSIIVHNYYNFDNLQLKQPENTI